VGNSIGGEVAAAGEGLRQSLKKVLSQNFGVSSILGFSKLTLTLLTYFLETEI
jgi:hypothetical protein